MRVNRVSDLSVSDCVGRRKRCERKLRSNAKQRISLLFFVMNLADISPKSHQKLKVLAMTLNREKKREIN